MENKEPNVTSTTTYDERRKVLVHKSVEDQTNDLGGLMITTVAKIHEEGIRETLKGLEKKRDILIENLNIINENLAPAPKMTPELQEFKDRLTQLQLIKRKENENEASIKKDKEMLKNTEKDLKMIEKDLKDIKSAIGTRLKL